jgi:hypothetical protein
MDPNLLTCNGQLALSLANQVETVELLLRNERFDPNKLDRVGFSALHMLVAAMILCHT